MATLLTATGAAAGQARASNRAGTIAFIRMPNKPEVFGGQLFVVHPDGSALRAVTPSNTRVISYAWSPDGKLIAYIDQQRSLWLVRPDGTGSTLLVPSSPRGPASFSWSPHGRKIALVSYGHGGACGRLDVVPIDGGKPLFLRTTLGCDVAWSPRGGEIAYDGLHGIWEIRPDGTDPRHISRSGGGVQWSADGTKLAFTVAIRLRSGGSTHYSAFAVVRARGGGFHVVTRHAYTEYAFAWSPRGRQLLYGHANREGIYVINADGRSNRRVTGDSPPQAGWGALAWSPSGSSIVYTAGPPENTDLYVIGVNGRDKVQLTSTPDVDIAPSWAP